MLNVRLQYTQKMKRTASTLICFSIAVFLLGLACKKKDSSSPAQSSTQSTDTDPPVVTLKGKAHDSIPLGSVYTDAGATAIDAKDGDISPFIVMTGSVNTHATGDYTLTLLVRDAAGNQGKATRRITVWNEAYRLGGNYLVSCGCTTLNPGEDPPVSANSNYSSSVEVSLVSDNVFTITSLNIGSTTVSVVPILFQDHFIPSFFLPGFGSELGDGNVNPASNSFTVTTAVHPDTYPNKTYSCTNVFTKQ